MTRIKNTETVTIEGNIQKETDKAILVDVLHEDGDITSKWIPLSQVTEIQRNPNGNDTLVISQWIYDKLELY